nr:putative ribonuclease H-like domain-containing protein [Tanacetum cinerariifolium]
MGHFARECRAPRSQDRGKRESYKQVPKEEEPTPKALMAIDNIGWNWSFMANEEENMLFGLERDVEVRNNKIEYLINELEQVKKEKEGLDNKLTGFESASKDLDNLLGSERSDKNKERLGYNADSGCSRHMTGNISYLSEYEPYDGRYVSFGLGGGKITDFKLKDDTNVLLKTPRQHNMYSIDLNNIVPLKNLTCLVAKASVDESMLWHRRFTWTFFLRTKDETSSILRNFITEIENLKDLKVKIIRCDNGGEFKNKEINEFCTKKGIRREFNDSQKEQDCNVDVPENSGISNPTVTLKVPSAEKVEPVVSLTVETVIPTVRKDFKLKDDTNVLLRTLRQHNMYSIDLNNIVPHKNLTCLIAKASVDESMLWHRRFTWTFFLRTKDETSSILRNFITKIENLKDLKVKIIKYDNRGEFKNKEMNEFCTKKGIRKEFNNVRTPQQNGVVERRNRTLIEAARTMLADAKLPVTFWTEAVNTAYVQNRMLVNKSQNKTPYELFNNRTPAIGFLRPFGCHVMILNTLYHLGKFDVKGDKGYFVGYSLSSKAFRVFNKRTKKVEENLHVDFLENKLIEKGAGLNWLFDIYTLTHSMNYVPVFHEAHMETKNSDAPDDYNADVPESSGISNPTATSKFPSADQEERAVSLTVESKIPTVSSHVPTACLDISPKSSSGPRLITKVDFSQKETPSLGNALTLSNRFEDTFGVEADLSNMETSIPVSSTPTFRIYKDHPKSQIISLVDTPIQTRHNSKEIKEQSFIHQKTNPELLQFCLFSCFLSQEEPKKVFDAFKDPSWVEAMQKELLQFKIQNV